MLLQMEVLALIRLVKHRQRATVLHPAPNTEDQRAWTAKTTTTKVKYTVRTVWGLASCFLVFFIQTESSS